MTMKIIGAVMIVSGFFFGGRSYVSALQKKKTACDRLHAMLAEFKTALHEKRCSFKEYMDRLEPSVMADADRDIADSVMRFSEHIKAASYEESCREAEVLCESVESRCSQYMNELSSKEKAIPIVAGTIGVLVAVLLL